MDLGCSTWGETQRVFGNSENVRLEKSEIKMGSKSVKPCHIRPVARGVGIKKGELRSVHLLQLVEAAGFEPLCRVLRCRLFLKKQSLKYCTNMNLNILIHVLWTFCGHCEGIQFGGVTQVFG